jgi:threonine dehydratase
VTLPTFADVEAAAGRLEGLAVRTPLLESRALNDAVGGRLLIKAEVLQRTGSFKFRGAYNCVSQLVQAGASGVVAYSSGNHAQGVAEAARLNAVPAVIVMPADAPRAKIDGTRSLGADVVQYDREREDREAIGARIADEKGYALVKPFDDARVIAGQGTVGLEIARQAHEAGATPDALLSPCGGGGLIGGTAIAFERLSPATHLFAVEPAGFDDWARSLAAGERLCNAPGGASFCDALLSPAPGELTFAVNRDRLAGGLVVTDAQVADAMRQAFERLKIVVEPGGAVGLAACLSGVFDCAGRTVAVICSGGNVDPDLFARVLSHDAP